jgi:L-asparaginase / beta-aspartyl-peptidase
MRNFAIVIHGGAGTILKAQMSDELEVKYKEVLKQSIEAGEKILIAGGEAIEAVVASILVLENCELFNAGKGAVFTNNETHELDASIMDGSNLNAAGAAGLKKVKNPILLCKTILEKSKHVLMIGEGAEKFAAENNLEMVDNNYFSTDFRLKQLKDIQHTNNTQLDHTANDAKKYGTVGAVALDRNGNLAAGTSTGGLTNKKYGRVGDTAIIGAGTFANKTCAVSCTGDGEYFIRSVTAYDIAAMMEYKNYSLEKACNQMVHEKLVSIGGEGGVIAIDKDGNIQASFNTPGMYRASIDKEGNKKIAIYK